MAKRRSTAVLSHSRDPRLLGNASSMRNACGRHPFSSSSVAAASPLLLDKLGITMTWNVRTMWRDGISSVYRRPLANGIALGQSTVVASRFQVIQTLFPGKLSLPRTDPTGDPGCQSKWPPVDDKHCPPPSVTSITRGSMGAELTGPLGSAPLVTRSGILKSRCKSPMFSVTLPDEGMLSSPGPLRTSFFSFESTPSIYSPAFRLRRAPGKSRRPIGHIVGFEDLKTINPESSSAANACGTTDKTTQNRAETNAQ